MPKYVRLTSMNPIRTRIPALLVTVLLLTTALAQYGSDTTERDDWQRPAEVMEKLGIREGSVVADIGAGTGYFTFRIARRVGPKGKVYSEDIVKHIVDDIRNRAKRENLPQIEPLQGTYIDAKLPASTMDVVLIADSYHEFRGYNNMLQSIHKSLKPGGLLGIIDKGVHRRLPRDEYFERHRINKDDVKDDAERNGFRFLSEEKGFISERDQDYFFLIFQKPSAEDRSSDQNLSPTPKTK